MYYIPSRHIVRPLSQILVSRVPPVWLPQVYYAAVVVDLLLRFNWLYSLIPPGHNPLPFIHSSTLPVVITTNVIVCEFLRRTMWGFFRVENEHLNNTEVTESSERREKYGRGYLCSGVVCRHSSHHPGMARLCDRRGRGAVYVSGLDGKHNPRRAMHGVVTKARKEGAGFSLDASLPTVPPPCVFLSMPV